jgi:hypothetical protein
MTFCTNFRYCVLEIGHNFIFKIEFFTYFLQVLLTRHLTAGFAASLKQQFQARVLYSQTAEVGTLIDSHIFSISLLLYSYNNFHFQDKTDKQWIQVFTSILIISRSLSFLRIFR